MAEASLSKRRRNPLQGQKPLSYKLLRLVGKAKPKKKQKSCESSPGNPGSSLLRDWTTRMSFIFYKWSPRIREKSHYSSTLHLFLCFKTLIKTN